MAQEETRVKLIRLGAALLRKSMYKSTWRDHRENGEEITAKILEVPELNPNAEGGPERARIYAWAISVWATEAGLSEYVLTMIPEETGELPHVRVPIEAWGSVRAKLRQLGR